MNDKEKCNKCRCWRETNDFIKNEAVMKTCIICRDNGKKSRIVNADKIKEGLKKYYIENADKVKEQQKKYFIENADKIKEQQKKHYEVNKEVIIEKQKKYNNEHKEEIIEKQKQHYETEKKEKPLHIKFIRMINNSKTNDKKYNRTYEEDDYMNEDYLNEIWIKQNGKCYYDCCKVELSLEFNKDFKNPNQISVQRLNNDIAHINTNIVLSCYFCNCVKHMENCDNELN